MGGRLRATLGLFEGHFLTGLKFASDAASTWLRLSFTGDGFAGRELSSVGALPFGLDETFIFGGREGGTLEGTGLRSGLVSGTPHVLARREGGTLGGTSLRSGLVSGTSYDLAGREGGTLGGTSLRSSLGSGKSPSVSTCFSIKVLKPGLSSPYTLLSMAGEHNRTSCFKDDS